MNKWSAAVHLMESDINLKLTKPLDPTHHAYANRVANTTQNTKSGSVNGCFVRGLALGNHG